MEALFALPYGPLLIFAMRVVDVSMGSVRILLMVRGWPQGTLLQWNEKFRAESARDGAFVGIPDPQPYPKNGPIAPDFSYGEL